MSPSLATHYYGESTLLKFTLDKQKDRCYNTEKQINTGELVMAG